MADGNATVTAQALSLTMPKVNAHWFAVKLDAFDVGHRINFATEAPIHFRRNLVGKDAAAALLHTIGMAEPVIHYRRNLAGPSPTIGIGHAVGMATESLRIPPIKKIFYPAALIDIRVAPGSAGDHSYSATRINTTTKLPQTVTLIFTNGAEIVYNIPETLPDRPHLLWPLYGTNHRMATPLMRWTPVKGAVIYEVHVARDINFLNRAFRFDTVLTELLRGMPFDGAFYWRVRAVSVSGAYSPFSEVWYFTTSPITPTQESGHAVAARARLLWQFQENAGA